MTMRLFIPQDAGAVAVGADDIVLAIEQAAAQRGIEIEIVRTGSRGLYWLEPLVEVATPQGRVAFGPVSPTDTPFLLDAIIWRDYPVIQGINLFLVTSIIVLNLVIDVVYGFLDPRIRFG